MASPERAEVNNHARLLEDVETMSELRADPMFPRIDPAVAQASRLANPLAVQLAPTDRSAPIPTPERAEPRNNYVLPRSLYRL